MKMDFSLENVEKMKTVVCPPSPEDVSKLILTGYHDAVAFLGKEFFRTCNVLPFSRKVQRIKKGLGGI